MGCDDSDGSLKIPPLKWSTIGPSTAAIHVELCVQGRTQTVDVQTFSCDSLPLTLTR